jgi:uncharacterized protein DUF4381
MEGDPLQQLRDVHLPPDPSWWPPAFGWWLVALILLSTMVWACWQLLKAYKNRAPSRAAQSQLMDLYHRHQAGEISAVEYLHTGNELLKRLMVRAYQQTRYASLSGDAWLQVLDEVSGTSKFTSGAASVLGNSRFSAAPEVDVEELHRALQQVLSKVKP